MDKSSGAIPSRLQEIIDDFAFCEGREKVELLLQYAEQLPRLPDWAQDNHDSMDFVEECMTPVYVQAWSENHQLRFYFDVPAESPTVRGFAAIMEAGFRDATPEEVLAAPNDFFLAMGLEKVLTMQRLNGLSAILAHMKRLAARELAA